MRVSPGPGKPVAIYDGECRFCGRWVEIWREKAAGSVEFLRLQDPEVAARFPDIPAEALQRAFHYVEADGTVLSGAKAIYRLLAAVGENAFEWAYDKVPGFGRVSEFSYGIVAANRTVISFFTRAFIPQKLVAYDRVSALFLRGLGLVYLAAFWSLLVQIEGLIGSRGITPIGEAIARAGGALSYFSAPTLCLWNSSDGFLSLQCWLGVVLALGLVIGLAPWVCCVGLWVLYLSLTVAGGVFLSFQWDNALLEAGLLAIFLPRWGLWVGSSMPPSRIVVWLLRWMMFRLMFESGCVKLLSGDETWWFLTALDYHYLTQPIPTPLAWHAHHLPGWLNAGFVLGMHFVELVLPFFIFIGRRCRLFAALSFAGLQLGILLTGNYGFFNFLGLVLCLPLLDDEWLRQGRGLFARGWSGLRRQPRVAGGAAKPILVRRGGNPWQWWLLLGARSTLAVVVLAVTMIQLLLVLRVTPRWPEPVVKFYSAVAAFRSINAYGLFANMTTVRYEIEVEGSADGQTWIPYEFKYKPDKLDEGPPQIGPHMPRLDWQMWFAALGPYQQTPWFVGFCGRLRQNEPSVTRLLATNPFADAPPQYIRARLYQYTFTTREERAATGDWWKRTLVRE